MPSTELCIGETGGYEPVEAAAAAAAAAAPLRKKLAYGLYAADIVGFEKMLENEDGPPAAPLENKEEGLDTDG